MAYLLINKQTKIAENTVEWDGDISKWSPPDTHIALPSESTPCIDWRWDESASEWIEAPGVGSGGIGDTWDGEKLIEPKPSEPPETAPDITTAQIEGGASVIE